MADTQKTLSFSAILVLAANTMNGPGITTLPDVCSDAGRILFITLIFLSVAMASFVCRRMVYAMWSSIENETSASVGKNEDYGTGIVVDEVIPQVLSDESEKLTHREHEHEENDEEEYTEGESLIPQDTKVHDRPLLERTSIVGQSLEAYGKQTSVYTSFLMVTSALCLGLAQMMLCAAILDGMFVALGGKSCALGLPSSNNEWSPVYCTTNSSMKPFMGSGAPVSLISIGWVIASTASVLMGSVALDEMMGVQYFLFGCLVVASIRFSVVLTGMTDDGFDNDHDSIVNSNSNSGEVSWFIGPNPFQCFGPIMFNFAFIVTSPPSVCLAKSEKIAYKALGVSCVVMGALYTLVGLSGASISNVVRKSGQDSNLLSLILLSGGGNDGASLFDLCIIGLFGFSTIASVPVYCLLAKDTLIYDAGVPPLLSFLLSNVLPWILVALTYNASFFEAFVNWSGLLVLGYANFSVPLMLDLKLKKVRADMAMSNNIPQSCDDEQTTTITKGVLIIVTASITGVIVMSISDSLLLAGLAFGSLVAIMLKMSH